MRPIFHLSFPVRDLDEAIAFYTTQLGATLGRREAVWADLALFGAQVTLQHAPDEIAEPASRKRHFGATLPWSDWEAMTARLTGLVEPARIDFAGSKREQAKAMLRDPSGNLIELKAYRYPECVLSSLCEPAA